MTTIKLKYPIQLEGRELSEITMRRPKVGDATRAEETSPSPAKQEVAMVAILTGLPPAAIEDLDMADYKQVQKVLKGFFG